MVDRPQAAVDPADRLVIAAHIAAERALLEEKLDLLGRATRTQGTRRLERLGRSLELAGELPAVAERLPDLRDLLPLESGHLGGRLEGALVELGRLEVRPFRLCAPPGLERVAPRRGLVLSTVEMQRE